MITDLAFLVYPVADIERAIAFYRDAVGLGEPQRLYDSWIEFSVGSSTFCLTTGSEKVGILPGSAFSAAFETTDLDEAVERLRTHSARMEAPFATPTCRSCFCSDPDGNRFALHQRVTAS